MTESTPRFYILHGEDEFNISQAVEKFRADMRQVDDAGLNTAELDGTEVNAAEVLSAVSAYPFLADRRLVIVRGMLTHITRRGAGDKGKKEVQRLVDDLPNLPNSARLVFVERKSLNARSKLVKLADKDPNGYIREFSAPKNLNKWLISRARREYDTEIEPAAAHALASVVGDDLRRADNELLKLVSYTGGDPITEETVTLLTPYTSETRIWDMIDAMAAGRGEQAMSMLHHVLADPKEDPFRVWALFVRQFRLMLLAKEHIETRGGGDLASALGMRQFQVKKLPAQTRAFSLADLEGIYRKIREYDTEIKTGQLNILLALDVLVATVAR